MFNIRHLVVPILLLASTFGKPLDANLPKWNSRGQVVFMGDSITDAWDNDGIATWNEFYVPLGAVNTGVSGDRTTTIIDRINNQGILDNLNAYLAVLKIGTNDLAGGVSEQDVVDNIGIIINLIWAKNPGCKVLLLGVLPRNGEEIHQRIRTVNAGISNYANDRNVFFLNMEAEFQLDLGVVKPELFSDGLHLTPLGYVVWAQTMNPIFDEILNAPFVSKVVLLGDDLTSQWTSTGASIYENYFQPIQSSNLGIPGQTSTNVLDRIETGGILDGLNSKVATLLVGGNDLQSGAAAQVVLSNIQKIIELIQQKLPHGRVLVLGLLPAGGQPASVIEQGRLVNAGLAQMDNGDGIRYLDMGAQFSDGDNIYENLYASDQTHLSLEGYAVWQATMDSLFMELLQFK